MRFASFSILLAFCAISTPALADNGDRCAVVARDLLSDPSAQLLSVMRGETACRIVYLERNAGKRARRMAVQVPYATNAPARIAVDEKRPAGTIAVVGK
jgi:hypothetical protein